MENEGLWPHFGERPVGDRAYTLLEAEYGL
jgi:hypothetical protein